MSSHRRLTSRRGAGSEVEIGTARDAMPSHLVTPKCCSARASCVASNSRNAGGRSRDVHPRVAEDRFPRTTEPLLVVQPDEQVAAEGLSASARRGGKARAESGFDCPTRRMCLASAGRRYGDEEMSCAHCDRPLHRAQWTDDEGWKSCPRCSQHHGREHVFRRFPDAFGTTPTRATLRRPNGPQSQCTECRGNQAPDLASGRLCSDLMTAA